MYGTMGWQEHAEALKYAVFTDEDVVEWKRHLRLALSGARRAIRRGSWGEDYEEARRFIHSVPAMQDRRAR